MKFTKIIPAMLAGIVLGLLIAPDKGSETRRKVTKKVNDISDFIHQTIENSRDQINDLGDAGIEKIEKVKENLNEAITS
jgi:gas vesicle protein